jgi:cell division protease FtsH
MTEQDMRAEIAVGLGGMLAEMMVFGEFSIGAWNDLQQVNGIVRAMVEQYGMSRLGVRVVLEDENHPHGRTVSDAWLAARDREIDRILSEERDRAERLLKEHESLHRALVDLLLDKKVLDAASIRTFVQDKKGSSMSNSSGAQSAEQSDGSGHNSIQAQSQHGKARTADPL